MAEAMTISLQAELREPLKFLESMGGKKPKMVNNLMRSSGKTIAKAVKKNYSNVLHKKTGHLYRTIRSNFYPSDQSVVVTAHEKSDPVRYGFVLAHGAAIGTLPSNKSRTLYIKDKAGNILARKRSVFIPPKDFIEGPSQSYVKTNNFKNELKKATDKEIDKLAKAAKKK